MGSRGQSKGRDVGQANRQFLGVQLREDFDEPGLAGELRAEELVNDASLNRLAQEVWREFTNAKIPSEADLAKSGLEMADLWKPGMAETLATCSDAEEIRRYRQKLEFRAQLLEALLNETYSELERAYLSLPDSPHGTPVKTENSDPASFVGSDEDDRADRLEV